MDNMKKLEKRWYLYKIKKSLVVLNSVGLVVILSLGSYYTYIKADMIKNLFNQEILIAKGQTETAEVIVEPITVAKAVEKSEENTLKSTNSTDVMLTSKNEGFEKPVLNEVSLEPIIPIVSMESRKAKTSSTRSYQTTNTKRTQNNMVKAKASTYLTASELSTIKSDTLLLDSEKTKKINLNGSSVNYIETMKKKFSLSKNSREALLLAKAFYGKKEYTKSEKWALTANKLNSNEDESWHIFAKSKAKLGQKDAAIKILSSYYKKSHSPKTKALIAKIKTGKL